MINSNSRDEDIARKVIEDISQRFAKTVSAAFSGSALIGDIAGEDSESQPDQPKNRFMVCDSAGDPHEFEIAEYTLDFTENYVHINNRVDGTLAMVFFSPRYVRAVGAPS